MSAYISALLLGLAAVGADHQRDVEGKAAASFKGLCSCMKALAERADLPDLISSTNETPKALLYTRLRVAKMTSMTSAKISLSVHCGDSLEYVEVIALSLSYYNGSWCVSSSEATRGYSSGDGKDKVLKLIMLIEESQ